MAVTLKPEIEERLNSWSIATKQSADEFINETLENALEDWEDYTDALKICSEIDSGREETYSAEEVWRELDEMDD